ncbi:hypothetical protein H337_23660 [Vibrio parahaemolyticus EN9701121]|nr:hypothetical protein H337_23660 [Vibrio parahaemolyticus EN9701121]
MPHWFSVLVGGECYWLKVWKGQVNRSFRFSCQSVAFSFSGLKAHFVAEMLRFELVKSEAVT